MKRLLVDDIYRSVMSGSLRLINFNTKLMINTIAEGLLKISNPSPRQLRDARQILDISNALYNNTEDTIVIEDGLYDLLIVWYENQCGKYPVGSRPIQFESETHSTEEDDMPRKLFSVIEDKTDGLYTDRILHRSDFNRRDYYRSLFHERYHTTNKKGRDVSHNNPELVGTLDKCKFVLNEQARKAGVFDDRNVKIFERDFIQKHLHDGIIAPIEKFYMVAELKYDGISVEAEVTDRVLEARSRGDTERDLASDLTPILYGYRFPRIYGKDMTQIGMKFEAIITYDNLNELSKRTGVKYKNCRSALTAIFGAENGRDYQDLITLVPLSCTIKDFDNRIEEIEFLNRFYSSGVYLSYAVLYGDYKDILFQAKKFTEEADYFRDYTTFLYDGVVLSYLDYAKIVKLGRKNSVNKYSIAIKFPSKVKRTMFTGYTFTIGSSGTITPMIHFMPVEFNGNVYTVASGYSYRKFKELGLRPGDTIEVSYVNEVMPYVTKPNISENARNTMPLVEFPKECPSCGTPICISDSGNYAWCPNPSCIDRGIGRITNFVKRLGTNGISIGLITQMNCKTIAEFLDKSHDLSYLQREFGPVAGKNMFDAIEAFHGLVYPEHEVLASVGFSSINVLKWKKICKVITIDDILNAENDYIRDKLLTLKGCGESTIKTILTERGFLRDDLIAICKYVKPSRSSYDSSIDTITVCCTGFRIGTSDPLYTELKQNYPQVEMKDNLTKKTNILLVPYIPYESTKVTKANNYGIPIMTLGSFIKALRENTLQYKNNA